MKNNECLVVITKYPEIGNVKTRLGEEIGMENASQLNRMMIKDVVKANLNRGYDLAVESNDINHEQSLKTLIGNDIQVGSRLSKFLRGPSSKTFEIYGYYLNNYAKVVMVFSDVPGVDSNVVDSAFIKLDKSEVVVGPDTSGGYYLLGMRKAYDLFTCLPEIRCPYLDFTLTEIRKKRIGVEIVETLQDIDRVEDIMKIDWNNVGKVWKNTFDFICRLGINH